MSQNQNYIHFVIHSVIQAFYLSCLFYRTTYWKFELYIIYSLYPQHCYEVQNVVYIIAAVNDHNILTQKQHNYQTQQIWCSCMFLNM